MGVRVSLKKKPVEVAFKGNPDCAVTVQPGSQVVVGEINAILNRNIKEEVQLIPGTERAVMTASGEPFVKKTGRASPQELIDALKRVVVGWRGLEDENGADVAFSKDAIAILIEPELSYQTAALDKDGNAITGEDGKEKKVTRFYCYDLLEAAMGASSQKQDAAKNDSPTQ